MVLSYLKKLKSESSLLEIKQTKKLIDNKYLYSINIRCPYARFIKSCKEGTSIEFSSMLSSVISLADWKYGNSYFSKMWRDSVLQAARNASPTQMEFLHRFLSKHKDETSSRIEHPNMTIYFSDEKLFEKFVSNYVLKYDIDGVNGIRHVSCPYSDERADILKSGKCVRTAAHCTGENAKYRYKVKLKSIRTTPKDLSNLMNYLNHAAGEIYFAPISKHILEKTIQRSSTQVSIWYTGSQFWTNDTSNIEPLSIICPGIIGKIEEYEVLNTI